MDQPANHSKLSTTGQMKTESKHKRRSTDSANFTSNETTNTSNFKTITNTIKQPNSNDSTKDLQARMKIITTLGNKYAETIVLHQKVSMEVGKLKRSKEENPTFEDFAKKCI
ncbi:hypothetical protein B9Z55_027383 [Caenorhabditis nigoni]|uniref:Uncharacterized protein n=1 Tax=Caenorhabditis nigoni TaxID=1611254 RepID=A0A2G5SG74_9PELO|nr:hypothetical protein B9Z55_027383 [Caenorhabditis nigoni]